MTLSELDDADPEQPQTLSALAERYERGGNTADELAARYAGLDAPELLNIMIRREFFGRLAVVSSFGAESAVILAMVAAIDPRTPVLFLDTGKLFSETLRYRDRLVDRLGLSDVRTIAPDPAKLSAADPDGMLWLRDPDTCCGLRKVEPLAGALASFTAWVSGRKRYHGAERTALPVFENDADGRVKINPLAGWSRGRVVEELRRRDLPRHPLEAEGYLSIGCYTCTDRVRPGEDLRAGRWRGLDKTECGIHAPPARGKP